jgi:hypothetical protein
MTINGLHGDQESIGKWEWNGILYWLPLKCIPKPGSRSGTQSSLCERSKDQNVFQNQEPEKNAVNSGHLVP